MWANAGLTNREIMAISGHRNESSLQSYHNMLSAHQLRKCSNVLSLALGDDQSKEHAPNQLVVRPPAAGSFHKPHQHFGVQAAVQFMHDRECLKCLQLQAIKFVMSSCKTAFI